MPELIIDRLKFSLEIAGTAMIIVFGMLLALMLIIKLQSFIINGSKKSNSVAEKISENKESVLTEVAQGIEFVDANSDCEIVAAIMAALSAHTGKSAGELNIRSIKRVNNNSSWRETSV